MQQIWRTASLLAALAGAMATAGCVRHTTGMASTGSIKDDPAPHPRPAVARVPAPQAAGAPPKPVAAKPEVAPRVERTVDRSAQDSTILAAEPPSPEPTPRLAAATPPPAPAVGPPVASAVPPPSAPAPAAPRQPAATPDPALTERYLEDGRKLFAEGKVLEARKRFVEALNGPIPDALLALARTFDNHYLSQLQQSDATPDMQRALTLYTRASERGSVEAAVDLERLRLQTGRPKQ